MILPAWQTQMSALLERLRAVDLGYPQGENLILPMPPPDRLEKLTFAAGLAEPSPLLDFYRKCGGVSLPDVHAGYFIHPLELVVRGLERGEPRQLTGPLAGTILVFGTDGGGGRFALSAKGAGEILYLGEGAVHAASFDGSGGDARLLCRSFDDFLGRLLADTEAFVRGDPSWQFMI